MHTAILVSLYLTAIVAANLITAWGGVGASVAMSFALIPFNLTARDTLHERWQGRRLWRNMTLLVLSGSVLSAALNVSALPIAVASFVAFAAAGILDTLVFSRLRGHPRLVRMNGSNGVSAAADSILFTTLAFGFPVSIAVVISDYVAKVAGGFVWSLILSRWMR